MKNFYIFKKLIIKYYIYNINYDKYVLLLKANFKIIF